MRKQLGEKKILLKPLAEVRQEEEADDGIDDHPESDEGTEPVTDVQ